MLFRNWHGPANNPQSPTRNNFRYNDRGGSVGGPILKNKLFAFFSYERISNNGVSQAQGWYETPQFLALAPAGSIAAKYAAYPGEAPHFDRIDDQTCASIGLAEGINCHQIVGQGLDIGSPLSQSLFPFGQGVASMDPSQLAPVTDGEGNILYYRPGMGGDGTGDPSNLDGIADLFNVLASGPNVQRNQQFNGRLDFNATSKDLIAFSIYRIPSHSESFNGYRVANFFLHNGTNEAETLLWNHTFSPTLLNELRVETRPDGAGMSSKIILKSRTDCHSPHQSATRITTIVSVPPSRTTIRWAVLLAVPLISGLTV